MKKVNYVAFAFLLGAFLFLGASAADCETEISRACSDAASASREASSVRSASMVWATS